MSRILKSTIPISSSSEFYVSCPTMINVYNWLMMHHTMVTSKECGKKYHVFAATEYPLFGSKREYISANVGIPLGPLTLELAAEINVPSGCFPLPASDQVTLSVKYPLLPSEKVDTFKGDLRNDCGITMSIGVPEIHGTIKLWIKEEPGSPWASLWIKFDLCVFGVEYKGEFAVLPIMLRLFSSKKFITVPVSYNAKEKAALDTIEAPASGLKDIEAPAPAGTVEDEANNTAAGTVEEEANNTADTSAVAAPAEDVTAALVPAGAA